MYIPKLTTALSHAACILAGKGVTFTDSPEEAEYLLYPAPTPLNIMADYTTDQTIIGGNLDFLNESVSRMDLLKDPYYLAANAAITAEAALGMMLSHLKCAVTEAQILILGWGRIGKCLTHLLKMLGTHVTVYARSDRDRAMLRALGYHYITRAELAEELPKFRCVINTVPAQILTEVEVCKLRPDCCKLDLASQLSIPGNDVIHARGLPGKCKPEASGTLIAKTILHDLGGVL